MLGVVVYRMSGVRARRPSGVWVRVKGLLCVMVVYYRLCDVEDLGFRGVGLQCMGIFHVARWCWWSMRAQLGSGVSAW